MSVLSGMGAAPAPIQGNIPFGSGGSAFGGAIGGPLGGAYMSAYNSALQQNQAQYQNILGGYQQTAGNQFAAQQPIQQGYQQLGGQVQNYLGEMGNALNQQATNNQGISAGYGQLQQNVLGSIQNITSSQQQAIANAYQQQSGQLSQNMINAGLGNTTVQGSMQGGLLQQEQLPLAALANQQAQLTAGYQSQLGLSNLGFANQANQQNTAQANLIGSNQANYASQIGQAGLGYANMANMQNTQQANNQLGFMNSVNMAYPNAQSYGQLSSAQAALQAQQATQAQAQRNFQLGLGLSRQGQGGGGTSIAGAPSFGGGSIPFSAGNSVGGTANYGGYGMQMPPTQNAGANALQGWNQQWGGVQGQGNPYAGIAPGEQGYQGDLSASDAYA